MQQQQQQHDTSDFPSLTSDQWQKIHNVYFSISRVCSLTFFLKQLKSLNLEFRIDLNKEIEDSIAEKFYLFFSSCSLRLFEFLYCDKKKLLKKSKNENDMQKCETFNLKRESVHERILDSELQ